MLPMTAQNLSEDVRDVISTCPVCDGDLRVTRLQCGTCGTAIEGQFSVGRFRRLNREQQDLLESFLRARGNLRELERELGISYPTVRNRIEALLRELGLADGTEPPETAAETEPQAGAALRREVLERLARREITAEQAAAELGQANSSTEQEPNP
ncbi:DUF2089 domain-containing protein [soil metagenome]